MPPALQRSDFLDDRRLQGREFCEGYTQLIESWLVELFTGCAPPPSGLALIAVGGQGRRELAPQSDLDLLLVHGPRVSAESVSAVADALWYPIWDVGLKLGHAVRTIRDTLTLANDDLETATALLSANRIWKAILAEYEPPPMDDGIREELADFVARRKREGGAPTDF